MFRSLFITCDHNTSANDHMHGEQLFLYLGEDVNGMSFQGADEQLLRRALEIVESQGKCTVFKGDTSEEDGLKFF